LKQKNFANMVNKISGLPMRLKRFYGHAGETASQNVNRSNHIASDAAKPDAGPATKIRLPNIRGPDRR
jgi:hypothetical protein